MSQSLDVDVAVKRLDRSRWILLCVAVLAQLLTVILTWQVWLARDQWPNLPVINVPQVSFGYLMLLSLIPVLVIPRKGVWVHGVVLLVACLFDQTRLQPQFLTIWVLMLAVALDKATPVVRWYLVAVWFWTGLHKLLSPDWYAHSSWEIASTIGLETPGFQLGLALTIGVSEVGLGILAWLKPRVGAVLCVMLHVGIVIYLSPWLRDWNYSVLPWNISMASIGCWILWNSTESLPSIRFTKIAFPIFLVIPIGFYAGVVDRTFAHVLYSENYPSALVTRNDGSIEGISGWQEFAVPIPPERRLFRQYFERTGKPGEKLHIADPRPWMPDDFYIKEPETGMRAISRSDFHASSNGVAGIERDYSRSLFALSRAGGIMKRKTNQSMVFAVELKSPSEIDTLVGIGNIEQLKFSGQPIGDSDLARIPELLKLQAIAFDGPLVTTKGLQELGRFPSLFYLKWNDRIYANEELHELIGRE